MSMLEISDIFAWPYRYSQFMFFTRKEERLVRSLFYHHERFRTADRALKHAYRFCNPYHVVKSYRKQLHRQHPHSYGETPLTSFHAILSAIGTTAQDRFVDLGSGRGRIVLFVNTVWNLPSHGIEEIPFFIQQANSIGLSCFSIQNMLDANLQNATIIYFYALCLEDEILYMMAKKLSALASSTRIITVSFPLQDIYDSFDIQKTLHSIVFPWGKTTVYINSPR